MSSKSKKILLLPPTKVAPDKIRKSPHRVDPPQWIDETKKSSTLKKNLRSNPLQQTDETKKLSVQKNNAIEIETNATDKENETTEKQSKRDTMVKPMHATNFNNLCDLSFNIKETDKTTQAFRSVCKTDSRSKFIKHFNTVVTSEIELAAYQEDLMEMSDQLRLLKTLNEFFHHLKSNRK